MQCCNCAINKGCCFIKKCNLIFFSVKFMGANLSIGLQYSSQLEYFPEGDSHIKRAGVFVVPFRCLKLKR